MRIFTVSKTCHFIGSSGTVTYTGLPPNRRRPFNFTVQATGPNGESLTIFRTFRTGLSFVPTDREGTDKMHRFLSVQQYTRQIYIFIKWTALHTVPAALNAPAHVTTTLVYLSLGVSATALAAACHRYSCMSWPQWLCSPSWFVLRCLTTWLSNLWLDGSMVVEYDI